MKLITKITAGLALALLFSTNLLAQKNFMDDANKAFTSGEYFNASELYKKAYTKAKKKEDKALIIFKTGDCYRMIGDNKQSEAWFTKAIKSGYSDPIAKLYLAESKKAQEKYNEALIEYKNYQKEAPADARGADGAKSCELAQKWKDAPTRYKVENMALINSKDPDFCPMYADKKYNKLYFTSMRPGGLNTSTDPTLGQNYSDIFETQMDKNGKWSTPTALPAPLNSKDNDGLCTMNKKGDMLIFTRCLVESKKITYNQLYSCQKKGNNWGDPELLSFCVDSIKFASPTLSSDGTTLIFSSNMPGGMGNNDLWMSKYEKKGNKWGKPVNLGKDINTAGNDVFPYLHEDGTLYFSSDTHLGMGGLDIFKAEKKGEDQWSNVTNLKYPMNSAGDDFGIVFEGKKERGYLSSNREGSKGADDIYSFVLPPLLFVAEGVVTDCKYKENVAGVTVKLVGSDGSSVEQKTDAAGYYKFADNGKDRYINGSTSYVLTVIAGDMKTTQAAQGFLNSSDKVKVTTVGVEEAKTFKNDFCLSPIVKEMRFPEVLYDLDKFELRPESKDSLDFLYQTLIDNPTITIELSAHTDSRGSDKDNILLSQNRAKSCFDYLVSKGIPAERMTPVGYGEKRLLISDKEIDKLGSDQEKEAAHQKNRRTVFTVLRKDYVNPNAPKEEPKKVEPKKEDDEE